MYCFFCLVLFCNTWSIKAFVYVLCLFELLTVVLNVLHKNNIWLENVTVDMCCAKIYIIPLIRLFWPKISQKKPHVLESFRFIDFRSLLECTEQKLMFQRYNHECNIILTSEMLVWNCFRLLTAKLTTISFTMTLKNGHCTMAVTIWS